MRCNAGVDPEILLDQHLIAEYRELFIPVGQMIKLNWISKSPAPDRLKLGKGHIIFWRDKQLYLKRRHDAIVREMDVRGFNHNLSFWNLDEIPEPFLNDWEPDEQDSFILRERIWEKIELKPHWYRMKGVPLADPLAYKELLFNSPVVY